MIGVLGNGKQELSYVREYLSKGVANWGTQYKVQIVEKQAMFLQELARIDSIPECTEDQEEELEHVKSYLAIFDRITERKGRELLCEK